MTNLESFSNLPFVVKEESVRSNFYQMPNIVHHIGLDPYEIAVYSLLKMIAGKKGQVIYSNQSLADMCNMSKRKLVAVKKRLSTKFEDLGCALIKVTRRVTRCGDFDTNEIIIIDIWGQNESYFKGTDRGSAEETPPQNSLENESKATFIGDACGASPSAPQYPLLRNTLKKYKNKKESSSRSLKSEPKKQKEENKTCDSAKASPEDDSFLRSREKERIRKICKELSDEEFEQSWLKYLSQPPGNVKIPSEWIKSVARNKRLSESVSRQREEIISKRKSWAQEEVNKPGAWNRTVTNEAFIIQSGALTKVIKFMEDNEFWKDMEL